MGYTGRVSAIEASYDFVVIFFFCYLKNPFNLFRTTVQQNHLLLCPLEPGFASFLPCRFTFHIISSLYICTEHNICSRGSSKNGVFFSPHLSLILNYVLCAPSSGLCSQWPGWSSKALEQRTRLILAQYFSHLATVAQSSSKMKI